MSGTTLVITSDLRELAPELKAAIFKALNELTTANETIARLNTDLQQNKALLESKLTLLASCETALGQRDAQLATKEAELVDTKKELAEARQIIEIQRNRHNEQVAIITELRRPLVRAEKAGEWPMDADAIKAGAQS